MYIERDDYYRCIWYSGTENIIIVIAKQGKDVVSCFEGKK